MAIVLTISFGNRAESFQEMCLGMRGREPILNRVQLRTIALGVRGQFGASDEKFQKHDIRIVRNNDYRGKLKRCAGQLTSCDLTIQINHVQLNSRRRGLEWL